MKATLVLLGLGDSLAGLYTYAVLATVLAILVLSWLGKLSACVGGEAVITREAEG
ncbi:MAG TPA: DUF5654 family protein [Sphingomonadaceae bacterium]|nr:DUF5654 family protein [Sphingomonadaceae bacterium]